MVLPGLAIHILQQRGVGVEKKLLFGLRVRAGFLQRHVLRLRIVGSHKRAPALEHGLLEQLEILRRLVDARRHEHRVAALAGEPRLHAEIEDDVLDHPLHARARTEHLLHRAPLLAQCGLLPVVQALRLGLEPSVHLLRRSQFLRNVARLIDKIENHLVLNRLAELVGVDVSAEHFEAGLLVLLQERRAGKADEHRARQQRLHRLVQLAALGAMALVHEDEQLADRRARLLLQFLDESIEIIHALLAELVDQASRAGAAWPGQAATIRSCPLLVR